MPHTHQALLDEVRIALENIPAATPLEERQILIERYNKLVANPKSSEGQISALIIESGKITWPYRKALESLSARYGRESERVYFKEHMEEGLRAKYEKFARDHKEVAEPWRHEDFETVFSAEEKYQIEEALMEAKDAVHNEMEQAILTDKKDEFAAELVSWQTKQKELNTKINSLRLLADRSPQFAPEILEKVHVFEEGWSVVERNVDIRIVQGEIEYYLGLIEG